jgi:hypothetical protein
MMETFATADLIHLPSAGILSCRVKQHFYMHPLDSNSDEKFHQSPRSDNFFQLLIHKISVALTINLMKRSMRREIALEVVFVEWENAFNENSRHEIFRGIFLLLITFWIDQETPSFWVKN